jgi:hypothetical protein
MMPILPPFREPSLMSPRTAKYVEAMIRLGDNFDYDRWLKGVREEEAEANQRLAASDFGQTAVAQIGNRISTSDSRDALLRLAFVTKTVPAPKAIRGLGQDSSGSTSKPRLRQRLERVQVAWHKFQASRARDAIYGYLEAVFAIVMHFKVRRRTKRLLRHAFEFADLSFDKRADPVYCSYSLHVQRCCRQQDH